MNGHAKKKAHKCEEQTELEEPDAKVGEQFAQKKSKRTDRSDEELLEGATLLLADDREGREESGDVEEHDGGEARKKEIGRARVGIEEQLGAHVHGKVGAVLQTAGKRFIEADGSGDVDGLAGDGRVRAVDEN